MRKLAWATVLLVGCNTYVPLDAEAPAGAPKVWTVEVPCAETQLACAGGLCVDAQTDRKNCGACGRACGAGETCVAGACTVECPGGQTVCGGKCTSLAFDPANCGACGASCAAGELCAAGACAASCGAGLSACDGACTNTAFDPAHCGACGNRCGTGEACVSGRCASLCGGGEVYCDGRCADLMNDAKNCGVCGNVCPAVAPGCRAGSCVADSCAAGLKCGDVSCCEVRAVPGGSFSLGRSSTGAESEVCATWAASASTCVAQELPAHSASVSSFKLDTFEVTVGRYRRFVAAYPESKPTAGAGAHPLIEGSGWQADWDARLPATKDELIASLQCDTTFQTWTAPTAVVDDALPINCVDWYLAFAFCAWEGGRLPTDAEWEYAASGGEDRVLPWLSPGTATAPDAAHASFGCEFDGMPFCDAGDLPAVGSTPFGAGRWGHQDLAGSLWEWTLDAFAPYSAAACVDCTHLSPGLSRTYRGGSFAHEAGYLRGAQRLNTTSTNKSPYVGVRCAR